MKNWKTNMFGLASIAVYVLAYFFPEHKEFLNGLIAVLIAGGLLSAKDNNVTGV
jgi:NhaP-type Na+/H+ or K+/H+ antiporter